MVGISLFDHQFLLGITEGYVSSEAVSHIGCGVVFYVTVPKTEIENVYQKHKAFVTSKLQMQSWGDLAFEAQIDSFNSCLPLHKEYTAKGPRKMHGPK